LKLKNKSKSRYDSLWERKLSLIPWFV
jgi:hypothetical protein